MSRAMESDSKETREKVTAAFNEADSNNDKSITKEEFSVLLRGLDPNWNDVKLDKLFKIMDADCSGSIEIQELMDWLFPKGDLPKKASSRASVTKSQKLQKRIGPVSKAEQKVPKLGLAKEKAAGKLMAPAPLQRSGRCTPSSAASSTSESDGDGNSSSSSSSSSEDEELNGVASAKIQKRAARKERKERRERMELNRHEEPFTTLEEIYENFVPHFKDVGARLKLGDFTTLFGQSKGEGLCAALRRIVPQSCYDPVNDEDPEDVCALEVGHLYCLLDENPKATDQDALQCILSVKDVCRTAESNDIREIGLDEDSPVVFDVLVRLVEMLSSAMYIDQAHILEQLGYSQSGRFAMTESMAELVMERLFLKSTGPDKGSVLEHHIKSNDFMRMCFTRDLIDNSGKQGVPHAQLSLFFSSTLQGMARIMQKRNKKRVGGNHRKRRKHQHAHRSLKGRSKLSVLFQELHRVMPTGLYKSPTLLVLSLLDSAIRAEGEK